jgi:hypothetical protein
MYKDLLEDKKLEAEINRHLHQAFPEIQLQLDDQECMNGIKKNQPKPRRKKTKKNEVEEGESVPITPAGSAKQMAKTRAFSKIDYSAMDKLFADD